MSPEELRQQIAEVNNRLWCDAFGYDYDHADVDESDYRVADAILALPAIRRALAITELAEKVVSADGAHLNTVQGGFLCVTPALTYALADLKAAVQT